MDQTTEQPSQTIPPAAATPSGEPKRPKILSVSQPQQPLPAQPTLPSAQTTAPQPALSKPRILTQIQSTPQPEITATIPPQLANTPSPTSQSTGADPKSEAEWAEQTLSQAEKDAEEQRMANDIAQAFPSSASTSPGEQDGKPQDGQNAPKTEPKSVHGVLYVIKGFADSISRKLAGK